MESIRSVIEKDNEKARQILYEAYKKAIEVLNSAEAEAKKEADSMWDSAKREVSSEGLTITSRAEIEGKRMLITAEDEEQKEIISEATEMLYKSEEYEGIIEAMMSKALGELGKDTAIVYGADDEALIKRLARKHRAKVQGPGNFRRGFEALKGDVTFSFRIDEMLKDMEREFRRLMSGEVGGSS